MGDFLSIGGSAERSTAARMGAARAKPASAKEPLETQESTDTVSGSLTTPGHSWRRRPGRAAHHPHSGVMTNKQTDAPSLLTSLQESQGRLGGAVGLSVVAPCFNELATLPELHRRVTKVCQAQAGEDYEIVLINDGSSDGTWSAILALA